MNQCILQLGPAVLNKAFIELPDCTDEGLPAFPGVYVNPLACQFFPEPVKGIQVYPVYLKGGIDLVEFLFFAYMFHGSKCLSRGLCLISRKVMQCAAFIAYPLAVTVDADRVQFAQNAGAFGTNPDDGFKAVAAECIFLFARWVLPWMNITAFLANKTRFHFVFLQAR